MPKSARLVVIGLCALVIAALLWWVGPRGAGPVAPQPVIEQYAELAHAVYADSLLAAHDLHDAVNLFTANPSGETLAKARSAWRTARVPYMQSEVFRFGNPPVDAWEGQVNAWPLDEGLIDYVATSYVYEQGNNAAQANLIASPSLQIGGETVDATELTPKLLADLNEIGGSEANVATGYHAIEFLLWGQDLNGTNAGAGERPYTDYVDDPEICTDGEQKAPVSHCQRRIQYLQAATELLINDLEYMVGLWAPNVADNYRAKFVNELPENEALRRILFGMGSLALGELAGERMKVALIAHSTEDEHDCFSDNTHNSHYYDALGIANVYHGQYERRDGSLVSGPSVEDLLTDSDHQAAAELDAAMETALTDLNELVQSAKQGQHFDQLISSGNATGNKKVQAAIDSLVELAGEIQRASGLVGISKLQPDNAGHEF